jgi:hypothetical protein
VRICKRERLRIEREAIRYVLRERHRPVLSQCLQTVDQ